MPPPPESKWIIAYTKQVAPGRAQTNPNDPNSKFETEPLDLELKTEMRVASQINGPSTVVSISIITDRSGLAKQFGTTVVNVLVIGY